MSLAVGFGCLSASVWVYIYHCYVVATRRNLIVPSLGFWVTITIVDWVTLIELLISGKYGISLVQLVLWCFGALIMTWEVIKQRERVFKLNHVEWVCLVLSVGGIGLWAITKVVEVAVVIQVCCMFISSLPFFQNALKGNESPRIVFIGVLASFLGLGTIERWSVTSWLYLVIPVVAIVLNLLSLILAELGCKSKERR